MTVSSEAETPALRKLSFTQYQIWLNCRHDWKLRYHLKQKPKESSVDLVFGRAIHNTIQAWLDVHYNKSTSSANLWDMEGFFKDSMRAEFKKDIIVHEDGTKTFPCELSVFAEYILDGIEILKEIKTQRKLFFPNEHHKLIGCEIELTRRLNSVLVFTGFIDIVVQDTKTGRYTILDLKTSKKGWYDYQKKDPKKINQILLYKRFYAEALGVGEDDIDVCFTILKRKLNENSSYEQKRLVNFVPAHGTRAVKTAVASFTSFYEETFDADGNVQVDNLPPTPSASACKFCLFKSKKDLCPVGIDE